MPGGRGATAAPSAVLKHRPSEEEVRTLRRQELWEKMDSYSFQNIPLGQCLLSDELTCSCKWRIIGRPEALGRQRPSPGASPHEAQCIISVQEMIVGPLVALLDTLITF